jgi:hypothetical protein
MAGNRLVAIAAFTAQRNPADDRNQVFGGKLVPAVRAKAAAGLDGILLRLGLGWFFVFFLPVQSINQRVDETSKA